MSIKGLIKPGGKPARLNYKYPVLYSVLLVYSSLFAQTHPLWKELSAAQEKRLQHIMTDERDSVYAEFDSVVARMLYARLFCAGLPDRDTPYITLNEMPDSIDNISLMYYFINRMVILEKGKLRVFSWDNLDGGSYHTYTNFIVWKDSPRDCGMISSDSAEIDAGYYKIEKTGNFYILFGYGSYGSGMQHYVIRVFKHEKGTLRECTDGYPGGKPLEIGLPRIKTADLDFDPKRKVITCHLYVPGTDISEQFELQFDDGKLIAPELPSHYLSQ